MIIISQLCTLFLMWIGYLSNVPIIMTGISFAMWGIIVVVLVSKMISPSSMINEQQSIAQSYYVIRSILHVSLISSLLFMEYNILGIVYLMLYLVSVKNNRCN